MHLAKLAISNQVAGSLVMVPLTRMTARSVPRMSQPFGKMGLAIASRVLRVIQKTTNAIAMNQLEQMLLTKWRSSSSGHASNVATFVKKE